MKVLLVSASTETVTMAVYPAGMHLVAEAARQAGHRVRVLDLLRAENDPRQALREAIQTHEPEVIGLSVRNIDDQSRHEPRFFLPGVRELVRCCRQVSRAWIVLGGAGYSIFPRSALHYLGADMGIAGQGEAVFPCLLDCLARGEPLDCLPGLWFQGKEPAGAATAISDPGACPLPGPESLDQELLQDETFWLPYQTRRGCPLDCSYCSTSRIEGRVIRKRPLPAVLDNLTRLAKAGVRRVFFVDNTFNLPPGYALELCRCLEAAGLDLTWRAILYPGKVSRELVQAMSRAGCREVSLGFESGSPRMLRQYGKGFGPLEVEQAACCLAEEGISKMGFLLLGGPGENRDTVEASLAFAQGLGLDRLKITIGIRIYPGTRLARQAVTEGLIAADDPLLEPRFYLRPGLEGWLQERIRAWSAERPGLVVP